MFKKLAAFKLVWPLGYVTTEYSKGFTTNLKQLPQTKSPSQWIFFNSPVMINKWLNHDNSVRNVKLILLYAGNNSPSSYQILGLSTYLNLYMISKDIITEYQKDWVVYKEPNNSCERDRDYTKLCISFFHITESYHPCAADIGISRTNN